MTASEIPQTSDPGAGDAAGVSSAALVQGWCALSLLHDRIETRTDRRGIYTDVTGAGLRLLGQARPTYEAALCAALDLSRRDPLLEPLVAAVPRAARHNRPKSL
ncbi:hypothetical protein [Streptomyces cucumeris]|uniref:hypothetical protein n=1 Tax=Streptomyces cucumeris TaxID=2962890 RepID=UPI003D74AEA1